MQYLVNTQFYNSSNEPSTILGRLGEGYRPAPWYRNQPMEVDAWAIGDYAGELAQKRFQ